MPNFNCFDEVFSPNNVSPVITKSRLAQFADSATASPNSEGEDLEFGAEDGRGWKAGVFPVLVVVLTAFPVAILLTLLFQFAGTVLGFFLTGWAGGYLAGPGRSKGFYVGIIGSTIACLSGVVFLLAVMSQTLQYSDVLMYFASYFLWLNLAAPVNLFLVVIPIGGVGGAFGGETRARVKKRATASSVLQDRLEKKGARGACSPQA